MWLCLAGAWTDGHRPDGKKKAYVRLTADHDALDVANKVRSPSRVSALPDGLQIGFI